LVGCQIVPKRRGEIQKKNKRGGPKMGGGGGGKAGKKKPQTYVDSPQKKKARHSYSIKKNFPGTKQLLVAPLEKRKTERGGLPWVIKNSRRQGKTQAQIKKRNAYQTDSEKGQNPRKTKEAAEKKQGGVRVGHNQEKLTAYQREKR